MIIDEERVPIFFKKSDRKLILDLGITKPALLEPLQVATTRYRKLLAMYRYAELDELLERLASCVSTAIEAGDPARSARLHDVYLRIQHQLESPNRMESEGDG
jgi:hypothetical protein